MMMMIIIMTKVTILGHCAHSSDSANVKVQNVCHGKYHRSDIEVFLFLSAA